MNRNYQITEFCVNLRIQLLKHVEYINDDIVQSICVTLGKISRTVIMTNVFIK